MYLISGQELRFESISTVTLKIQSGVCEHLGSELLLNHTYTFYNPNTFIFAHTDVKLQISECENYKSFNSSIPQIAKYFSEFSKSKNKCIVVGQGRSTFTRILSEYIVRSGQSVLITDLSLNSGYHYINCLSSCLYKEVEEQPIVFYYGSTKITNAVFYKKQLNLLAEAINLKAFDQHIIISSFELLSYATEIDTFNAEIVVLKDEKMFSKLRDLKKGSAINLKDDKIQNKYDIVKFIDHGTYERKVKDFNDYFNGQGNNLVTYSILLNAKVVRIGEEFVAPMFALPIGQERKIKSDEVVEVKPKVAAILGVSYAKEEDDVVNMPIKGFVKVENVSEAGIKVRGPQSNLKCSYLIHGDY